MCAAAAHAGRAGVSAMQLAELSIRRPVFATVLSLLVLLPTVEGLLPVAVEAVVVPVLPVAVPVVLPVLAVDAVVFVAA